MPAVPAPGRRPRLLLVLPAVVVVAVGLAVTTALRGAGAAPVGQVHAVATDAPATAGWGQTYVDERGRPARWDPCTPIAVVVQERWAPAHGRRDLAEALQRLSAASGLRFTDEGSTDELPSTSRAAYQPERYGERWAPLLVGWAPRSMTDLEIGDGVQGLSLSVAVPSTGGPSLVTGQVVLDADNRLSAGFGPGTTEGEVLLHELAHAIGLGHVLDPTQVMYSTTTDSESQFGAGDRAGLAALGASAGCHPAPDVP